MIFSSNDNKPLSSRIPIAVTVDYESKEDNMVTVRDRDTEAQERAKAVEAILKRLEDGKKDELELLADKYDQEKALLEAAGQDITDLTTEYETQRLAIIQKNEEAAAEIIRRTEEAKYNRASAKLDTDADQEIFMAEIEISNEQLKAEKIYEINRKLLEDKIALQEEYLANFTGDIETQLALETELAESKQALGNLELQYKKDLSDREIELAKETAAMKKEAAFSLVDATVAILDMMADLSEEDSKKQKNLQIASTTIQTIAGAAGAFLQGMMQYGLPFGAIIGAAGAAVATATGIAQIAKIKSTNTSSSSSPSGSIASWTSKKATPIATIIGIVIRRTRRPVMRKREQQNSVKIESIRVI